MHAGKAYVAASLTGRPAGPVLGLEALRVGRALDHNGVGQAAVAAGVVCSAEVAEDDA